jgi:hypothetical protein
MLFNVLFNSKPYISAIKFFFISVILQDPADISLLTDCCAAAEDCCNRIRSRPPWLQGPETGSGPLEHVAAVCPPTWDGWQCWEDGGKPGKQLKQTHKSWNLTTKTMYVVFVE